MQHKVEIVRSMGKWLGICECKAHSEPEPRKIDIEDWVAWHHREVQRARAHLRGRAPSLSDQYDYYRRMETDPATPARERAQWKILADGLEHRIGVPEPTTSMFEETG